MKQLLILGLALWLVSCTDTPVQDIPVETPQADTADYSTVNYEAMGSANKYTTPEAALSHANSGRTYYFQYSSVVLGSKIYETSSTIMPVQGNGSWIAISFDAGYTWSAVKVDDNGLILAIQ